MADVAQFLGEEVHPDRFTKALCYGSFQYFPKEASEQMLCQLYSRFTGVRKVFIGNVPDKERHHLFYTGRVPSEDELADPEAQIGVWYSQRDVAAMARAAGWHVSIERMTEGFYAANYRYNVILER